MKASTCGIILLLVLVATMLSLSHEVRAAPGTADAMNALTVCGAGVNINIDANLKGSIASLYEKEVTQGRAIQQIMPEIAKLLPQGDNYKLYLDCVKNLLARQ
jgi:hypothetical protein